ncbi:uncharacterized protein LTR77_009007 [Saxophila tyrrhenica]|uniref:Uncharacterized protein n=1 Tax=Saxophila tyrrhenica TaxID=1690608 RepID=A0AAV9NZA3_9PEZI|nr:hypothetical protein LTR77_009007 [Saxophila tyrrhenica]
MSARAGGKEFVGLVPPTEKRPVSSFHSPFGGINILRDSFEFTTWMCLAALVQGLLLLGAGRLALLPAAAIFLVKVGDVVLQTTGIMRNRYLDGVIFKKTSVVFPSEEGKFGNKPSNQDVVVFLIGTRYNHPLGLLAPYAFKIAGYFIQMVKDLEDNADEFGFLGATSWQNTSAASSNELLVVCYFKNVDGLHKFAHSKYHLPNWNWWNKTVKEMPHITIFHETYHVPAGNWESIHVNSQIAGLGSTVVKVAEEMTGKEVYTHPIVDASKGVLRTSAGRMARSDAREHEGKLDVDPYDV